MDAADIAQHLLDQLPEAPCDTCGFSRMCRDQLLACGVFANFVDRGKFDRDAPRRPTSRIYRVVFGEEREGVSNLYNFRLGHRAQDPFPLNIQKSQGGHQT